MKRWFCSALLTQTQPSLPLSAVLEGPRWGADTPAQTSPPISSLSAASARFSAEEQIQPRVFEPLMSVSLSSGCGSRRWGVLLATDSEEEEEDDDVHIGVCGGLVSQLPTVKNYSCCSVVTSQLTASDESLE